MADSPFLDAREAGIEATSWRLPRGCLIELCA
jgi:hypothetical protein